MSDAFRTVLEGICAAQGWELRDDAIEISLEDRRHQTLAFRFFEFEEQSLVRLYTVIGDATRMDATRLGQGLRVTFKLPHGALALDGNKLVVVDTISVDDTPEQITAIARYLVETGDHFEKTMFGVDDH